MPEEDQNCTVCGTQMTLSGEDYVRLELEFIPATCKVNEYYSQSYGCPFCKEGLSDTEKTAIRKSQVPDALVGKGSASVSTVAWTMYQRYVCQWASPLPAEESLEAVWVQISRTTLANWIIYCSQNYCMITFTADF
ncbi:IS66 family transposase zinc-finger binding domain-containing protein [Blautia sp. An249]|uniref:IS66 family transposase zinc-finger binding domain-containing protein n=1 Tax=Blautia sp. An249 TaxID=1965603 RepID=UPI002E8E28BA|nr:IS66 family transposase zinc-finger binding domain-containing protein [Blautia sp. An249]